MNTRTFSFYGEEANAIISVLEEKDRKISGLEQQLATKDAAIELYNKALLAAFPEGARGEVFILWNEARKELGK